MPLPPSLLQASLNLVLDPGLLRFGIDLFRERYGTEWTVLDGRNQVGSVRARFTITAPPGVTPHWVLLTLQHDDGRRMVAHVSYGERVLARLPDGHFQMLAFFLTQKQHRSHKPTLLAVASAYRGLFIGKQRVVNLIGRVPNAADIATMRSAGADDQLPFALPRSAPSPLRSAARLQLPYAPIGGSPAAWGAGTRAGRLAGTAATEGRKVTPIPSRNRPTPRLNRRLLDPASTARLLADTPAGKTAARNRGTGATPVLPRIRPTPTLNRLLADPGPAGKSAGTAQSRRKQSTPVVPRTPATPTLNRLLADPALAARLLAGTPPGKLTGTGQTPKKRKRSPRT